MYQKMFVHYAVQVCDTQNREIHSRYASDNRTEISQKCIMSLLQSIGRAMSHDTKYHHFVALIMDRCSPDLVSWCDMVCRQLSDDRLTIIRMDLFPKFGIAASIEHCWHWLQDNGTDLVWLVQDDMLFDTLTVQESIDIFMQIKHQTQHHCIVHAYNDCWNWQNAGLDSFPRTVVLGLGRYWTQIHDISCSFLTSHAQFERHWDMYDRFLDLLANGDTRGGLEALSLNHILTQKSVLGLTPIPTLIHHLQDQPDPYQSWRPIWDNVCIEL
jgi:hypothetical protein